jgi:hypothetical protein
MPDLNIGQQGKLRSTPKLTRINGDDHAKVIYRNLGNNHAYPFIWATTAVMEANASEVLVASGIKWHGYDLASYASVIATPDGNLGSVYVVKDKTANTISIKSSATLSEDTAINVMFMLGGEIDVEGLFCRGNTGATQNLP